MSMALAILGLVLAYLDSRHEGLLRAMENNLDETGRFLRKFSTSGSQTAQLFRVGIFLIVFFVVVGYFVLFFGTQEYRYPSTFGQSEGYNPVLENVILQLPNGRKNLEAVQKAIQTETDKLHKSICGDEHIELENSLAEEKTTSMPTNEVSDSFLEGAQSFSRCDFKIMIDKSYKKEIHRLYVSTYGDFLMKACNEYNCLDLSCEAQDNISYVTNRSFTGDCNRLKRFEISHFNIFGVLLLVWLSWYFSKVFFPIAAFAMTCVGHFLHWLDSFSKGHALKSIGLIMAIYGVYSSI